jgi:protein N-terminal amidase
MKLGTGFGQFDLGDPLGRISLGICMDLNPFPPAVWTSREGPYELANFAINHNTRLLIILCAWLDSKAYPDEPWDKQTVDYWLARLLPLWRRTNGQQAKPDTVVVICNRAGADGGSYFPRTRTVFASDPKARHTLCRHVEHPQTFSEQRCS